MEYYKSRQKRSALRPLIFVFIIAAISALAVVTSMRRQALDVAVYKSKVVLTQYLQETVIESIDDTVSYEELVHINKTTDGKISTVIIDSAKISKLQAVMTKKINEKLTDLGTVKTSIPLGTLTGSWYLSGRGPLVNLYTAPVSAVSSDINHRFVSAGINQTRHSVELEINVDAKTLILGEESPLSVSTGVVLSDTIIVGVTPEVFAGIMSGEK